MFMDVGVVGVAGALAYQTVENEIVQELYEPRGLITLSLIKEV